MNIPYCVLKEQRAISYNSYEYHQSLAKRLYNSSKKIRSSNISSQYNHTNYSKKKIFKWLFTLDFKTRIKICSIYNDWFTKILFQLLTYSEYDNNIKFEPKNFYENFYKKLKPNFNEEEFDYKNDLNWKNNYSNIEENFATFFDGIPTNNIQDNKNKIRERDFLKELRFYSIYQFNDTLTLSFDLLNSKTKLQEYFDTFSSCKIFTEKIISIKPKKNTNIFNFTFPNWISTYESFTVQQIIVICFEQIISVYYQIYLSDGVIPNYEIDSKINDLLNININLENYLGKIISDNEIFDMNKIKEELKLPKQKELLKYYDNISENVYEIAFDRGRSEFFNDEDIQLNEIKKCIVYLNKVFKNNISNFVNIISFIDASHVFKTENIIYDLIYQKIYELYTKNNLEELQMNNNDNNNSNNDEKLKNKKKRKKKRKNNTIINNNSINNNNNNDGQEINYNNLNIEYNKENHNMYLKNNEIINNNNDIEYNNVNSNYNSINSVDKVDNRNNNNNSDEDEDNIFSNDCFNKFPESIERIGKETLVEKNGPEYVIEMKDLNENGKEIIKNEEEDKKIEEKDLLKELLEMDLKGKKKKKKKKKNNKKQNINKEKEEIEKEKENENNTINLNNIENKKNNNEAIKNENNQINNINLKIIKEENKNNKKKDKEFFLFPTEINKKKKGKKKCSNKNKQENNDQNLKKEINNESDKEINKSNNTLTETTISENNNIEKNKSEKFIPKKNNNIILVETKESKIEFKGKKIDINNENNKIDYVTEFNKTQIVNSNNPIINNYIIIEKEALRNTPSFFDNKMNPNIFIPQNSTFTNNFYPALMPSFNYSMLYQQLPNYCLNEQNNLFNNLSKEILSYEEHIINNLDTLKKYREETIKNIKNYIEKVLIEYHFEVQLINYGSYVTKLSIEISDIDILIKFCKNGDNNLNIINNQKHTEEIISLLYNKLDINKDSLNILVINAIYTASVPVLKIKCSLENLIPNDIKNQIKKNYLFNYEEDILQLNFDFTFHEVNNIKDSIFIPSLEIVSYIQNILNNYKEIKPILLFLKRYMKINNINSSFHGGLSSYSLFLLLYAYIKSLNIKDNSIGQSLYGFFEFYSNFNFGIYSINVNLNNPFVILNELHESGIMLIDPITKLNVAKSTFRIDQIKSVLMKGMIIIRNIIYRKLVDNSSSNTNNEKMIFLEELFKNKNGTIILEEIEDKIYNQISLRNWR